MTELYNSCILNTTPSRKRKRKSDSFEGIKENATKTAAASTSCFTNAAFSSTPKKIVGKRRLQLNENKENVEAFSKYDYPLRLKPKHMSVNCEHKEITTVPHNPYEVLRKPPKKKKRHIAEELVCFENPALNLDLPEKLFNPYEVVRGNIENKNSNCFSNPALNLKIQDASIVCNPFEVQRQAPQADPQKLINNSELNTVAKKTFVFSPEKEKDFAPIPCEFELCLPFIPKLGCRIDFKNASISQLTPSKLLAEKLVFSPIQNAKLSLSFTGEESSMDIGKELDRYQLELENSINEAKLRKSGPTSQNMSVSSTDNGCKAKNVHLEQKTKFTQKLCDIEEDGETDHIVERPGHIFELNIKREVNAAKIESNIAKTNSFRRILNKQYEKKETDEVISIENLEELYGCCENDKENSFDFITPTPFVRAYARQETTTRTVSEKSQEFLNIDKPDWKGGELKKSMNVKNIIRRSLRKLVPAHRNRQQQNNVETSIEGSKHAKEKGIINAIRYSFRKKVANNFNEECEAKNQVSIIDNTERTMKLKSTNVLAADMKIENLTKEKKMGLPSCLRKSTREMRDQFLKSVLHKKREEYDLQK